MAAKKLPIEGQALKLLKDGLADKQVAANLIPLCRSVSGPARFKDWTGP
jgi:hypothetical protein